MKKNFFLKKGQIKFGEIYVVDLGKQDGHRICKTRPCLIIKRDRQTVVIIPLTRGDRKTHHNEFFLGEESKLRFKSKLKTSHIQTVDVRRLRSKIGELPESMKDSVIHHIGIVLFVD